MVENSKMNNLEILAILDTHYNTLIRLLPKSYRKNDELKAIHKKIRKKIQSIQDFADEVNIPINKKLLN